MRKAKKNEVKICLPKVPILTARESIGDTIKTIDTDDYLFTEDLKVRLRTLMMQNKFMERGAVYGRSSCSFNMEQR